MQVGTSLGTFEIVPSTFSTMIASTKRAVGYTLKPYPIGDLPVGRPLELPGRGTTFITDSGPQDAPVVFLLHSVMTTGLLCWYPVIPELSREFRVITMDHRWHGRGIRSPEFTLEDCADDVAAVADELGIERFTAVGFSMGGGIAQLAWRRHRDRVEGLVLCSTGPYFSSIDPLELEKGHQAGRWLRHLDRVIPTPSEKLRDDLSVSTVKWAMRQIVSTPFGHQGDFSEGMSTFDSRPWLAEIDVPTSVVISLHDKVVSPYRQQLLVEGIPRAQRYEVEGGHACCVLGAERFIPPFLIAVGTVIDRIAARREIAAASAAT